MTLDPKMNVAVLLAMAVQFAGVFIWFGAAEDRLRQLEARIEVLDPLMERLVRVEVEMQAIRSGVDRIDRHLDRDLPVRRP
jgi:Tfp pilus assembly protein PilO